MSHEFSKNRNIIEFLIRSWMEKVYDGVAHHAIGVQDPYLKTKTKNEIIIIILMHSIEDRTFF